MGPRNREARTMGNSKADRREFLQTSIGTAAAAALSATRPRRVHAQGERAPPGAPRIRFAVIGLNHGHIYGQTDAVVRGGGELASFYAKEAHLAEASRK